MDAPALASQYKKLSALEKEQAQLHDKIASNHLGIWYLTQQPRNNINPEKKLEAAKAQEESREESIFQARGRLREIAVKLVDADMRRVLPGYEDGAATGFARMREFNEERGRILSELSRLYASLSHKINRKVFLEERAKMVSGEVKPTEWDVLTEDLYSDGKLEDDDLDRIRSKMTGVNKVRLELETEIKKYMADLREVDAKLASYDPRM